MKTRSDLLGFAPDAWELSVVTHRPRRWLPASVIAAEPPIPRVWATRAARGFSWHPAGPAVRRERAR